MHPEDAEAEENIGIVHIMPPPPTEEELIPEGQHTKGDPLPPPPEPTHFADPLGRIRQLSGDAPEPRAIP